MQFVFRSKNMEELKGINLKQEIKIKKKNFNQKKKKVKKTSSPPSQTFTNALDKKKEKSKPL